MIKEILMAVAIVGTFTFSTAQSISPKSGDTDNGIVFYIHEEVDNAEGQEEQEIIQLWKDYLLKGKWQDVNSPYWSFENMKVPDENFWAIGMNTLKNRAYQVQCKIIGLFKVEQDHYCLVSSFAHLDAMGEIHLDVISKVYAKRMEGEFLLISSAEYYKSILEHYRVGAIDYYVHPFHTFRREEAEKMNQFNQAMAEEFGVEPLAFDYFVANSARHIVEFWGYAYMNRMYNPAQTGGVASWRNNIIYSGNNSSYFPHELVHLYTYHVVPKDPHLWVGEGIATFYGGKAGHSLDWHLQRLRQFLQDQPNFDLSDINALRRSIPNGEHISDFRYIIGGLLMRKIYIKEGVDGLVEALQYGNTDESFWHLLQDKLGITRKGFDHYIKQELQR